MSRTLLVADFAVIIAGFTLLGSPRPAMAQNETYSVRVRNQNNFPIMIKRTGMSADDNSADQIDPGAQNPIENILLASDQVFSVWLIDGSNSSVGALSCSSAIPPPRRPSSLSWAPRELPPTCRQGGARGDRPAAGRPAKRNG